MSSVSQHLGVSNMLALARADGAKVIFTGLGGDEQLSLRRSERSSANGRSRSFRPTILTAKTEALVRGTLSEPSAPASVVPEPSLQAFACRSPLFLQFGLWPISPLCAPELIRFCEWLPREWREAKRLHRVYLERLGLSASVVHPAVREDFSEVMHYAMREHAKHLIEGLLRNSALVDAGYVDGAALRQRYEQYKEDCRVGAQPFYEVAALELALQNPSNGTTSALE